MPVTPAMTSHRHNLAHQPPEARCLPLSFVPGMVQPQPPPVHQRRTGIPNGPGMVPQTVDPQMPSTQLTPQSSHLAQLSQQSTPQSQSGQPSQRQQESDGSPKPLIKHRRAPVACRRCRRLRSKCQHSSAKPPCVPCYEAGPQAAAECFFPARGEPDKDREFRRRRFKASEKAHAGDLNRSSASIMTSAASVNGSFGSSPAASMPEDRWELLPPLEEVIEGCRVFFTSYFQLGFLSKSMFIERLQKDKRSVRPFLLLGLLGITARFVPKLVKHYGGPVQATQIMIERARRLVPEEMYEPTLDRVQGFFLLGVAEWGNGDKVPSSIHMGLAVRMAGILRLHQEEAYDIPKGATADDIVNSEVARRTFWVIISQDSLHSGATTPASFALNDITALLPCDEGDFAFGIVPKERAALSGTMAAKYDERLVWLPSRSLFATLIQAHSLWGHCARSTLRQRNQGPLTTPWQPSSRFAELAFALQQWEENMPQRHRWSLWNLRGYRSEALDLAYLAIVMVIRLSNIVIRRVYLEEIMNAKTGQTSDNAPPGFWDRVSIELFTNVLGLHEQVDAFFSLRSHDEGFPAMIVFCVYTCGSLAYYLAKWPALCPPMATRASTVLERSMEVLKTLSGAWPLAMRWQQALNKVSQRPADSDSTENLSSQGPPPEQYGEMPVPTSKPEDKRPPTQTLASASANLDLLVNAAVQNDRQAQTPTLMPHQTQQQQGYLNFDYSNSHLMSPSAFPIDDFETELNAFIQGGEAVTFWNGVG